MYTLFLSIVLAQPAVPQVPIDLQPKPFPSYSSVYADGTQKSVVVFVGGLVPVRDIKGAVSCVEDSFYHTDNRSIITNSIIVFAKAGNGWQRTDLSINATDAEISTAAKGVRVIQRPFRSGLRRGEIAPPDDDDPLRSLRKARPALAEYIDSLEPYKTSTQTQHTQRRWSGVIFPSMRKNLQNFWQVPGNLDGVEGWSSNLYRTKMKPAIFLVRQDPSNSVSAITWNRSYPDQSVFADVLRNGDGAVFEVRLAHKIAGNWSRFVAYRDRSARPHGYVPIRRGQCASCHSQAGRSEYDGAAVPGGDEILSDPYPHLEAGQSVQGGFGLQL